jgi:SulP family sulfate permease
MLIGSCIEYNPQIDRKTLAFTLSLLVGIFSLTLGLLRAGNIFQMMKQSALKGFINAAALIIFSGQLPAFVGYKAPRSDTFYDAMKNLVAYSHTFQAVCLCMSLASLFLIAGLTLCQHHRDRHWILRGLSVIPPGLTVVIAATLVSYGYSLDREGLDIVENIPSGVNVDGGYVNVAAFTSLPQYFTPLAPSALMITIVGYMESFAVSSAYGSRFNYKVDGNVLFVSLGLANIAGSMAQSFPTAGSLSRTSVNVNAGAVSKFSGVIVASLMLLVIFVATGYFYYLPKGTLAAIIGFALTSLFDFGIYRKYYEAKNWGDALFSVITFSVTLAWSVEVGISFAVIASLLCVVYQRLTNHGEDRAQSTALALGEDEV